MGHYKELMRGFGGRYPMVRAFLYYELDQEQVYTGVCTIIII